MNRMQKILGYRKIRQESDLGWAVVQVQNPPLWRMILNVAFPLGLFLVLATLGG